MHDDLADRDKNLITKFKFSDSRAEKLGVLRPLAFCGRKAKWIGWSTSQGECKAAVGAEGLGQLVAGRRTEFASQHDQWLATLQGLTRI